MYISDEDYKKLIEMASSYDKVKAAQKKYRENNREKYNQRIYDWRARNKERFDAMQKKYKEKKNKGE